VSRGGRIVAGRYTRRWLRWWRRRRCAAFATIYATAEPLTIDQKNEYAQAFWTCLSTRMTEQTKKSVTRALLAAIEHRDLMPRLCKPRTAEEEVPAPAAKQGGRNRGERSEREGDRDGGRDRQSRSGEREPRSGDRKFRKDEEERRSRPICENYRRDGKCDAHAKRKCKDKRHPDQWRNIGEDAYKAGE